MEITISYGQGRVPVTIFHLNGDLLEEEPLQTRAREAFEAGTRNLLLDMSQVPYISSQGLRALHFIFMLLRSDSPEESDAAVKAGITAGTFESPHLKLLKPSKNVAEVLKISGYDMYLQIHKDFNAAIASF